MPAIAKSSSTRVDAWDAGVALASAHVAEAHAKCIRFKKVLDPENTVTVKQPINKVGVPVIPHSHKSCVTLSPITNKVIKPGATVTPYTRPSASASQKLKSKVSRPSPKRQSRLCFTRKRNNNQIALGMAVTRSPSIARSPGGTQSNLVESKNRRRECKQMPDLFDAEVIDLSMENTSSAAEENLSTSTARVERIAQLRSVFMNRFSDAQLIQALDDCGGDVNAAVMKLL